MNSPIVFRYVLFALFALFSVVTLALAGGSISQTKILGSSSSIVRVDALLIVDALLGLLALFIIIPLERIRPSAFSSRISIEVCWVGVLCLLDFCASAAVTAIGVEDVCSSTWRAVLPGSACGTVGALQAFSWLSTFTLLFHLLFLVFSTRSASARIPGIWKMTVIEVEWSGPSSPSSTQSVLPTYHEKQIPVYTAGVKPLIIVEKKATLEQPAVQKVAIPPTQHKRTSDLVVTPASVNATPPLYPQFFTSTQARAAAQQSSPAGHTASPNPSSTSSSPRSGRSSPASSTSSSPSSPVSSSQDVASRQENEPSSRSSSPRTKRRPPPLNLGGLSAFNAAEKSKRQARA